MEHRYADVSGGDCWKGITRLCLAYFVYILGSTHNHTDLALPVTKNYNIARNVASEPVSILKISK